MSVLSQEPIVDRLDAGELFPALKAALLDGPAWRKTLENFAQATNLAVALVDVEGQLVIECLNPRPTWSFLHAHGKPRPADWCPFALPPLAPCTCHTDAMSQGTTITATNGAGLVHFAVPLILQGHSLGTLLAGQVFAQFPEQLAVEWMAEKLGLKPGQVWALARLEAPVKQATLRVYAGLLANLGQNFLENRFHRLMDSERLDVRKRAQEVLQDEDHRKNEFLAMLAHELRNPLAPILNALQIIRLSDQRDRREQAREMLERQVRYMVRLIDDLLDISRISRGKVELRLERVELATVVKNAVETSRSIIEARGHELTVKLPPEPLWLDADPIRLAQVLANLLNNAAKYTPNGGRIALIAEREGQETGGSVGPASRRSDGGTGPGSIVIRVRDTGVGISAEMLPRVFELFTQADRSLDRAQGGLGIGLSVARALLDLHGGSLTASSDGPGQGSEFTVHLPLATQLPSAPTAETAEEIRAPSRGSAGLRILVVDDNRDATESLSALLHLMGHEVRCAYEGPAALTEATAYDPDLILLDIGLPGMSGLEVARHIRREQPNLKHAVLAALTGWGTEEDRRLSREAGFDHHLVKPVDSECLEKLLASVGSSKE